MENARLADTVIYSISDQESLSTLRELISTFPKKKFIVVSAMSPIYLQYITDVQNVIATYSNSPFSFLAVFSAIAGDFVPRGKMPLSNIK